MLIHGTENGNNRVQRRQDDGTAGNLLDGAKAPSKR
jgi:hypothetical protein